MKTGWRRTGWRIPEWGWLAGGLMVSLALIPSVDPWLSRWMRGLDPAVADIARIIDDLGDAGTPALPLLVTAAIILILCRHGRRTGRLSAQALAWCRGLLWRLMFIGLAMAAAGAPNALLKYLIGRSRPKLLDQADIYTISPLTFHPDYFSFPSGHANTATAWTLALGLLIPGAAPWLATAGFLIGFTRVVHNAHFLSDVVFGACLAVFMTLWLQHRFQDAGLIFTPTGRRPLADPETPTLRQGCGRLWRAVCALRRGAKGERGRGR